MSVLTILKNLETEIEAYAEAADKDFLTIAAEIKAFINSKRIEVANVNAAASTASPSTDSEPKTAA